MNVYVENRSYLRSLLIFYTQKTNVYSSEQKFTIHPSDRRRSLICSGGSSPTANDEAGPTGKTSPIVKRNWRSYETELEVAAFVLADAANDPVLVMMLVIILITLVFLVTLAIRTRMYTDRLEAVYMKLPPNPHETTVLSFKKFH